MRRYSCRKFREEPLSGPTRFLGEALIIETNLEASTEGCRALSFRRSRGFSHQRLPYRDAIRHAGIRNYSDRRLRTRIWSTRVGFPPISPRRTKATPAPALEKRIREALAVPVRPGVRVILLAYRHGLRASELCDLQWHQIELNAGASARLQSIVDGFLEGGQDRLKRSLMNSGIHPEAVLALGVVARCSTTTRRSTSPLR
jgi:integrase